MYVKIVTIGALLLGCSQSKVFCQKDQTSSTIELKQFTLDSKNQTITCKKGYAFIMAANGHAYLVSTARKRSIHFGFQCGCGVGTGDCTVKIVILDEAQQMQCLNNGCSQSCDIIVEEPPSGPEAFKGDDINIFVQKTSWKTVSHSTLRTRGVHKTIKTSGH